METSQALAAFSALSQETRLSILRLLIRDGVAGIPAGEIAARLDVQPSTLSFHIAALERAGLVRSRRAQRHIIYAPNLDGLRDLVSFLTQDCCGGQPEICGDIFAAADGEGAPRKKRR